MKALPKVLRASTVPPQFLSEPQPIPHGITAPDAFQPCVDLPERMVPVTIPTLDAYAYLGVLPERTMRVREGLIPRLVAAQHVVEGTDQAFGLVVLDAHRTINEQYHLGEFYDSPDLPDWAIATTNSGCRPSHVTGGAVDLTLSWNGIPLALGTDFDDFTDEASPHAFETRPGLIRDLRRMFSHAMRQSGFVPDSHEWWHWAHGDDVWAHTHGMPAKYEMTGHPPAFMV